MVDRQAKRRSSETFSRQGKGSAIRDRSGIPSQPCHREGGGEGEGEMRPPRQRNGWTPEEDDQLRALAESGERPTAIAKHLARGEHAIRHRLYKLCLLYTSDAA